jgi:hypothetical protein
MRLSSGDLRHSRSRITAPPSAALIGVEEMPRGVGATGGTGSSISSIISPSSVGSTVMASRSTGASGLASVSHSAGSGTDKTR